MLNRLIFVVKSFDQSEHPRHEKGAPEGKGGQFAKKGRPSGSEVGRWLDAPPAPEHLPKSLVPEFEWNEQRAKAYKVYRRAYQDYSIHKENVERFNNSRNDYFQEKIAPIETELASVLASGGNAEQLNAKYDAEYDKYKKSYPDDVYDDLIKKERSALYTATNSLYKLRDSYESKYGELDPEAKKIRDDLVSASRLAKPKYRRIDSDLWLAKQRLSTWNERIGKKLERGEEPWQSDLDSAAKYQSEIEALLTEKNSIDSAMEKKLNKYLVSKKPGGVKLTNQGNLSDDAWNIISEGMKKFNELVGSESSFDVGFAYRNVVRTPEMTDLDFIKAKRAYYDSDGNMIVLSQSSTIATVVHELGHALENNMKDKDGVSVGYKAFKFWESRVYADRNAKVEKLKDIYPGSAYEDYEYAYRDSFPSAYAGKIYNAKNWNTPPPTEIMSLGLQWLHENPVDFAENDPDYFIFVMSVLRGLRSG